jgi:methylmalonyl-CoA mutase
VCERLAGEPDAEKVNRDLLSALENGASAVWLGVGAGPAGTPDEQSVAVADLPVALRGVLFDLAPLALDAGAAGEAAAAALFAILDGYPAQRPEDISVALGLAPLTSAFGDSPAVSPETAVALAQQAIRRPETVRALTVCGDAFHNAGAADAQELGASVAAGLEYLRALTEAGVDVTDALGQLLFRFAATDDQFATIAKFRAGRRLWARVAHELGAPAYGNAPQHAVTSAAMLTRRDPWVNLLRTTLAAFGAGVGGADLVTVQPFDAALPLGELGVSQAFSQRMARNTQLLLLEESHLGHVQDPGAGSWHVESLTEDLAQRAWEFLQELERAGGYRAALTSGLLAERIAATRVRRDADIAHRKTAVTGVNEFPNLAEPPLSQAARGPSPVAAYGAAFEALRDRSDAYLAARGARPQALLVPLGTLAEHNVRVTWTANLLATGGIETINPGPLEGAGIAAAVGESRATLAVLCSSDARYTAEAGPVVEQLRAAGIATVLLAGPEKAVAELAGPQRPDGFLTARVDAAATLSGLLEKLGA